MEVDLMDLVEAETRDLLPLDRFRFIIEPHRLTTTWNLTHDGEKSIIQGCHKLGDWLNKRRISYYLVPELAPGTLRLHWHGVVSWENEEEMRKARRFASSVLGRNVTEDLIDLEGWSHYMHKGIHHMTNEMPMMYSPNLVRYLVNALLHNDIREGRFQSYRT